MNITHAFVSAVADDPDATLVRPSDWNAGHSLAFAASQRVAARDTAGAGAGEEVTASQILDWVSSTNGVLLTRTAGSWGAVANWATDSGDLIATENASPVAPATGKVKIFGSSSAGRQMPAFLGPAGAKSLIQPLIGNRSIQQVIPTPGAALMSYVGINAGVTGTLTARSPANTNMFTGARRAGYVSAAGAGSPCGLRHGGSGLVYRGGSAGCGGFHFVTRFGISDAALVGTANMFVGVQVSFTAPTDVDPASLANLIGVGCTNGDTVLQLYAADATPRAKTSLGASFPVNTVTTDLYELALFCPPNGSDVRYQLTRINTGDVATGTISAAANLPLSTTMLTFQAWRSNGGTASAVGIDLLGMYLDSDN